MAGPISDRMTHLLEVVGPVVSFMTQSTWAQLGPEERGCDFVVGNPHEMPLPAYVEAIQRQTIPRNQDWFAYKLSEPQAQTTVAASLCDRLRIPFVEADIFMTNGAFAGLSVTLSALVDPGDEVIFISPPWFFYETLIVAAGGVPVRVKIDPATFDLDLAAIERAITPRTRAIIVNSPHNPTGKIYPLTTLEALAQLLINASERVGRPIYLLSDEAYSRILYAGHTFHSPVGIYPYTIMIYTYGKVLLTPGQRIGYLALSPSMPDRPLMRGALMTAQVTTGYAWPNALLQHALPELEHISIDLGHLERKRNRIVAELRHIGYDVSMPEGTFYLLPRSPLADDMLFTQLLAQFQVYVLPGSIVEMPGYFRISLTANDDMIDRSLAGFAAAWQSVADGERP